MPEETESIKLLKILDVYEKILHPDIFYGLKKQLNSAYEENRKEAFANANISDDALWIEKEINYLKENFNREPEHPELNTFHIKCFYKKLLKHFIQ